MRRVALSFILLMLCIISLSQVPESFNYQAIPRNSSGGAYPEQLMKVRISILPNSATDAPVYVETFSPTTTSLGLINLQIGLGAPETGTFGSISWGSAPFFMKVEIDPTGGTSYTDMGTTQLLSVPYSLYSKTAQTADYNALTNLPVLNITSWNNKLDAEVDGSVTNEIQTLSILGNIISLSDGGSVQLPSNAWSLTGNTGTAASTDFIGTIDNVPLNFRVNNQKAGKISSANGITTFGYQAGNAMTSSINSTAFGFNSLQLNTSGNNNTAFGNNTLRSNTTGGQNTATGDEVLNKNTTGVGNTGVGYASLAENTTGYFNTAVGYDALLYNNTGMYNSALGSWTLHFNTIGERNTAVGFSALQKNFSGFNNTGLGNEAGYSNVSGSNNVFLGFKAGYNEMGSNKLYIANNETTPIISGDFSTNKVGIGKANPLYTLDVAGDVNFTGNITKGGSALTIDWTNITTKPVFATVSTTGSYVDLSNKPVTDGSETKISSGTNVTVTGAGTTASPYVINSTGYYLGQEMDGGIIYHIYRGSDGMEHGLIVSLTETTATWQSVISLVNANRSWDGMYNTDLMTNSLAKDFVTGLGAGWYLPSLDELSILWQNRFYANNALFSGGYTLLSNMAEYWSSTEHDAGVAWPFNFMLGTVSGNNSKGNNHRVRGVRAF